MLLVPFFSPRFLKNNELSNDRVLVIRKRKSLLARNLVRYVGNSRDLNRRNV